MITRKNRKGFTLAELMLAVAIIIILASLIFVGVARYLRNLRLLEMDNAAKEIYFAAQNRITAELVSGNLGRLNEDKDYLSDKERSMNIDGTDVYVVRFPDASQQKDTSLWDELLPFGAIDDTLRMNGYYIITYTFDAKNNLANVRDVWYTADNNGGFFRNWTGSQDALKGATAEELRRARIDGEKKYRLHFPNGSTDNAVIGHYGGEGLSLDRKNLGVTLELKNDEVLYLKGTITIDGKVPTTDNKTMAQVNVIVEGRTSRAIKTLTPEDSHIEINDEGEFFFVLDDVTTANKRFRDQFDHDDIDNTKVFYPGEDIRVTVEVYSNSSLANIDRATAVDNSLFQYVKPSTTDGSAEAGIGKVRHLQNLSNAVSGVELGLKNTNHPDRLGINSAKQTADLVWDTESHESHKECFVKFKLPGDSTAIGGNIYYNKNATETAHTVNSFYPIDLTKSVNGETFGESYLTYDGEYTVQEAANPADSIKSSHSISNLVVNDSNVNHAGIFGTVGADKNDPIPKDSSGNERVLLTVQNLEIDAAKITGKNTAGAVVANEVNAVNLINIKINNADVTASNGQAGGAVGQAVNGLTIKSVAVSESHVSATGHAGGLVGQFDGVFNDVHIEISKSSVQNSTEPESTIATYDPEFSVISTGTDNSAGGLVGAITKGYPQIFNSFSTALVKGDTAGGLVGEIINSHMNTEKSEIGFIRDCYVGGHVTKNVEDGLPVYSDTKYNVTGTKYAGGFIGSFEAGSDSGITVLNSYSTASACGETAGGFVGNAAGEGTGNYRISNCYAVGLVKDTNPDDDSTPSGAFAGNVGELRFFSNQYFELVSKGLTAVGGSTTANPNGVLSAETNLQTYNAFVKLRDENTFDPYHKVLEDMFKTIYYLPTVKDLDPSADDSMSIHVGDWQPVDTLVTNTPDGT